MLLHTSLSTGLAGVILYFLFKWWKSRSLRGLKAPPGPPGRFLIGNLLDLPTTKEWLTFNQWAKDYGDLVYVKIFGISILFVNSYELARELFDKRGHIYSDRANSVVLCDLVGMDWTLFLMPYGETWRQHRTYFHKFLSQTVVQDYRDVQTKYTKVLLKLLYQSPEGFRSHIRFIVGATILEVTYGIQTSSEKDSFISLSEDTVTELTRVGVPGTYLVDVLPLLKHVPIWFPGAKFRRDLKRLRGQLEEMVDKPVQYVKHALRDGKAIPCIATSLFEQFESNPDSPADYEEIIKKVTGTMYMTGIDTTDGYLLHFVKAMLLHPHVQKRAQEELDEVVGSGGLPSFDNFGKLKYIRAIIYEVLRWNTTVPAAIPHMLKADDVVNGYFIPKGTIVFGTSWTMLRSESVYGSDASKFNPERFLDENVAFPDFGFGYGRRACPGRYFAETSAFIITSCILHLFHILPTLGDDNSQELPGEEDCDSGVILRPKDFKCRFIPRSSAAVRILEGLDI